jgi:hypothetical protein
MHRLVQSIRDHTRVPTTFDGEIPEFAYDISRDDRLVVGRRYVVKDDSGEERIGTLTQGFVSESEKIAYCIYALDGGKSIIASSSLSELELQAYRQSPETFFGVLGQPTKVLKDPLELYDVMFSVYSKTPKEKLLEFMAAAPDLTELSSLSQSEVARIYCERLTSSVVARNPIQRPPFAKNWLVGRRHDSSNS